MEDTFKYKGISKELYLTIKELMEEEILDQFNLGGGTNLAIKYDHRISTDIDLFSAGVVGCSKMNEINNRILDLFSKYNVENIVRNNRKDKENLTLIISGFKRNNVSIKIDIIQNIPLNHPLIIKDGIRLIHDLDIGALKLLSAADRGTQKDFYDLYFLSQKYGLEMIYDELMKRHKKFPYQQEEYKNVFSIPTIKPKETLEKSIVALGDFNKSGDKKNSSNRLVITENSPVKIHWAKLKQNWVFMLNKLALKKNLFYKETPIVNQRNKFRL